MIQPRSLRRVTVFVVVLVLCAILSAGGAKAEAVYTIRDLAVDSSAVSAAEARSLALASGASSCRKTKRFSRFSNTLKSQPWSTAMLSKKSSYLQRDTGRI